MTATLFGQVEAFAGDPILSLNDAFKADPRTEKVNLSIGVYTDGSRLEISDRVTFSTGDANVAVVRNEADRHGRVEGVARGVTVAQATEPITGIQSRNARIVVRGGRRGRGR